MRAVRLRMLLTLFAPFALVVFAARAQDDAVWRVAVEAEAARVLYPDVPGPALALEGKVSLAEGALRFVEPGGKATIPADARLGADARRAFTLSLELRTERGAFATPLMCREGGVVHYSLVIGRREGHVSFEPWCWQQARAESRSRIDDGRWHRLDAVFEPDPPRIALLVDGRLESEQALPMGFEGSTAPALRLGDNLDPNVRQAFLGEIREVALKRDVPQGLAAERKRLAGTRVLAPHEADRALEAWNDRQRVRRAPVARDADDARTTASRVRALVQDALGLWPVPYSGTTLDGGASPLSGLVDAAATDFARSTPSLALDVREGGTLERDGWRVTRVYWAAFDGWHASGWLYRPTVESAGGRRAAVLCPHGHWSGGATHPVVQSRCIVLARMGFVVLAVDSVHVDDDRLGLTPLSAMIWSDLRGLELLRSLPEVDATRIGCTGASGGGQQTYYLAALDAGLAATVPAVMACHLHEILGTDGPHCHCNHVPHLVRVTDMPIMGAAFAPRPQLYLTVSGDWTREFPERGFPEIAAVYETFGARDAVAVRQWQKGHDYDREMRNPMYAFFARHLQGVADPSPTIEETDVATEDPRSLRALDAKGVPADLGAIAAEFTIRLGRPAPSAEALARDGAAESIRARLRRLLEAPVTGATPRGPAVQLAGDGTGPDWQKWLVPADADLALPVLLARADREFGARCVIVTHPDGKSAAAELFGERIAKLRADGITVLLADLRYSGELDRGARWRDLHGRFYGLDEGQLAVRDLWALLDFAATQGLGRVAVLAHGWTGASALLAAALDPRIAVLVAPELGASWASGPRRPRLARVLLHADLPDAAYASRASRLLLGNAPDEASWSVVDAACGARLQRSADPIPFADIDAALRSR